MGYIFKEENFKTNLMSYLKFLVDYRRESIHVKKVSQIEWICLNEKTKKFKFENLLYNRVLKYQADTGEIKLFLSVLNADKENQKFNLEISYNDEPDFLYQVPCISDEDVQEALKELHNDIRRCHYAKMEKFDGFLNNEDQWK